MNKALNYLSLLIAVIIYTGCSSSNEKSDELELFVNYYSASQKESDAKWNFTTDTVKLWFDDKEGEPSLRIKDKKSTGKWKEWDEIMNSSSTYDSVWFDKNENAIKGYFYENNDFYELIGKKPTKTLRTYWLNKDNIIHEILLYWIPEENTTTAEHLKPIVEWALINDSIEISELYPEGNIIPSRENAIRWKKFLKKYNEH